MNKEEVLKLAKLARIEIGADEAESLSHEFDAILKYVGEIKEAKVSSSGADSRDVILRNVLRDDINPHESGMYTEKILKEAPNADKSYIKVKKIL